MSETRRKGLPPVALHHHAGLQAHWHHRAIGVDRDQHAHDPARTPPTATDPNHPIFTTHDERAALSTAGLRPGTPLSHPAAEQHRCQDAAMASISTSQAGSQIPVMIT